MRKKIAKKNLSQKTNCETDTTCKDMTEVCFF
jgi:hypothetical protein